MGAGHRLVIDRQDFFGRLAAAAQEGRENLRVGRAVGVGDADGLVLRIHNKFLIPLGNGLDGTLPSAKLGETDDFSLRVALQKRLDLQDRPDGSLGYTRDEFWRIAAEYPVKAIMGCDAHAPSELDVVPAIEEKKAFLHSLGIPVLDTLPGLE